MNSKMSGAQFNACLLVAAVGPILSVAGRGDWITTAVTGLVCVVMYFCIRSIRAVNLPRWICIGELAWLIILLGVAAKETASCWIGEYVHLVIPVILLFLAACAARNGVSGSTAIGATLLWIIIPILGGVFLAGTGDVHPEWIANDVRIPDGMRVVALLLPCLYQCVSGVDSKSSRWIPIVLVVIAISDTVLLDSVLGANNAEETANGFYELSKSVNLFGVAERFEAMVACALTGSWFVMLLMILSAACRLIDKICPMMTKWSHWVIVTLSGGVMCILPKSGIWVGVGTLIFWGLLPVLTQEIGVRKNIEKK